MTSKETPDEGLKVRSGEEVIVLGGDRKMSGRSRHKKIPARRGFCLELVGRDCDTGNDPEQTFEAEN